MVAERGGEQQEGVIGDVRPSARGWATLRDSRSWSPGQRKAGCVLPLGSATAYWRHLGSRCLLLSMCALDLLLSDFCLVRLLVRSVTWDSILLGVVLCFISLDYGYSRALRFGLPSFASQVCASW